MSLYLGARVQREDKVWDYAPFELFEKVDEYINLYGVPEILCTQLLRRILFGCGVTIDEGIVVNEEQLTLIVSETNRILKDFKVLSEDDEFEKGEIKSLHDFAEICIQHKLRASLL